VDPKRNRERRRTPLREPAHAVLDEIDEEVALEGALGKTHVEYDGVTRSGGQRRDIERYAR
jgi:hypothetical protein